MTIYSSIYSSIYKYLTLDHFCKVQDLLHDLPYDHSKLSVYNDYFANRRGYCKLKGTDYFTSVVCLKLSPTKKRKKILLNDLCMMEKYTLCIWLIDSYQVNVPLNILIGFDWPPWALTSVYRLKSVYYIFKCPNNARVKVNSVKSATNLYNYKAVEELLGHGIIPSEMDIKIAKCMGMDRIIPNCPEYPSNEHDRT